MDQTRFDTDETPTATQHLSQAQTQTMAAQDTPQQAKVALDPPSATADVSGDDNSDPIIPTAEQMRIARVVKGLPNEILDNIFACLYTVAPSDTKLYDEPVFDLTSSETTDLKASSMVCWRWRRVLVPVLFKHMRLIIKDPIMPGPIMRNEYFAMVDFVRRNNLKNIVTSFALSIRNVGFRPFFTDHLEMKENDFTPFWIKIFEIMNPLDVKIVCPASVLGLLTGCEVSIVNHDYFEAQYHYLQLRLPAVPPALGSPTLAEDPEQQEERALPRPSVLFEIRPWTALLLNEGSFVQGYKKHGFHEKEAPSILDDLIGDDDKDLFNTDLPRIAMMPESVRDFSYIAMFPTSGHFHKVARRCPRLDRLYTQLVPRNDILEDSVAMDHIEPNDMWLERNTCYAFIMRELFSTPPQGNYRYLREFESGDAADVDAWEMAVEYVKRAGGRWRVEKPGVFVKDVELAEESSTDPGFEEGQVPSLLSVPPGDLV